VITAIFSVPVTGGSSPFFTELLSLHEAKNIAKTIPIAQIGDQIGDGVAFFPFADLNEFNELAKLRQMKLTQLRPLFSPLFKAINATPSPIFRAQLTQLRPQVAQVVPKFITATPFLKS